MGGTHERKMLRVPHRHVVMTLPHILLDLVKRNRKEMLNILMRTSAETLKDWMMHKFGLKTGVIADCIPTGKRKQHPCTHAHDYVMGRYR